MPPPEEPLDKFGRFVMENLRDRAIDDFDRLARGEWRAPSLQALQAELGELTDAERATVRRCVVRVVDGAIHDFLFKLQERADFQDDIAVLVDGENVVELSDGIQGEAFGPEGWQARFSKHGQADEEA